MKTLAIARKAGERVCRPASIPWLVCMALLLPITLPARAEDSVFSATYQEVRSNAVGNARTLLQRQAASERASAASNTAAGLHIELLQEIDRPQRWVLLEWASDAAALQAVQSIGSAAGASLQDLLVAPPDIRRNHELPASDSGGTLANDERLNTARAALYAVIHLDIGRQDQSGVTGAIAQLIQGARMAGGNLGAEAWQQDGHANHYTLLFLWRNRAARDAFTDGDAARQFRNQVGSLLGSPYDERFYRLLN